MNVTNVKIMKIKKTLAEKYRPKAFDDLIGNKEIISKLKSLIDKEENITNLFIIPKTRLKK